MTLLATMLPWVLIFGIFFYFSRRMQKRMGMDKGGGPFGFGKSKARLHSRTISELSFEDVAGMENVKRELQEMVEYLKDPSRFQSLGGELPKGVLLVGPPGTGKTFMARAVAGEAEVPFYSISGSEFIEMFVGVGASRARDMFEQAKKESPAIIFIDEIDSIGRVRGTGLGGGHDEREQTLNQILSEMDGFSPTESVVVMAATNRPDVLDPALVRPGRFDRRIQVEMPQRAAREKILALHSQTVALADDVDLGAVAGMTVGFSGADLKNLVNEAALLAARKEKEQVEQEDFQQGRDKIIMGIEREDRLDGDEKKIVAYHEAGHALVAKLLPEADPLEKVTIIPRGQSLGATEQIPEEDRHNLSRTYLLNRFAEPPEHHARWPGGRKDGLRGVDHRRRRRPEEGHPDGPAHGVPVGDERHAGSGDVPAGKVPPVSGTGDDRAAGFQRAHRQDHRRGGPADHRRKRRRRRRAAPRKPRSARSAGRGPPRTRNPVQRRDR